jgi:hypothetical protein
MMSPLSSRRKRVPPERSGPIRNPVVPASAGTDDAPRATRSAAAAPGAPFGAVVDEGRRTAERLAEISNTAVRGAMECGVQTAYTVIDEYMARGREAAGRYHNRPNGRGPMNDDRQNYGGWSTAWGPMSPFLAPWTNAMRMWTDALTTFAPGAGPQQGWSTGAPDYGAHATPGGAAPFTGAATPRVSVKVSSRSPAEVTLNVAPFADRMTLVAGPLQKTDGSLGALPLTGVSITCEPGHVRVSVTVITDQPPGRYSGVILNAIGNDVVGTLTVEIAAPHAPSA